MIELELSLMEYPGSNSEECIRPLLDQFERQHDCRIRVRLISWGTGREELVKVALDGRGPDVSEIGTTWCSSFISMQSLRPFTAGEIASYGGNSAFFPSSWQSCKLIEDPRIYAVPWLAAIRVIYYRRDLLERAGVDEKTAFLSHGQLTDALQKLRNSGISTPLALETRNVTPPVLHSLASWVWARAGVSTV